MPRKDTGRVAILKGYVLRITWMDGSQSTESFDTDELGTLDDRISGLMINDLADVSHYVVRRVWSEPGETVSLKVKQQGE